MGVEVGQNQPTYQDRNPGQVPPPLGAGISCSVVKVSSWFLVESRELTVCQTGLELLAPTKPFQ